jgi:glycosyltransferase involved in cell wall biosynthesis
VSHATPLARCGFRRVIVVTHGTLPEIPGVFLDLPPRWLTVVVGRALAKLVWTLRAAARADADLIMGYHIVPNSTIALIVGRILRRPTCYQMTSGPVELIGGGYLSWENPIQSRLGGPSAVLERLAIGVARQFDLVVVRGADARKYVHDHVRPPRVEIVPGSVDLTSFPNTDVERTYDAVFVAQMTPRKQPLLFIDAIAAVTRGRQVRAAMLGEGVLMGEVRKKIETLGLQSAIEIVGRTASVGSFLSRAKIFVLPSRSEGLSIAMAEAMICGAVPVVADVGDLKDLVRNGETGYLIERHAIDDANAYAEKISSLLANPDELGRLSHNASVVARANNGIEQVTSRWARYLGALISQSAASGLPRQTPN